MLAYNARWCLGSEAQGGRFMDRTWHEPIMRLFVICVGVFLTTSSAAAVRGGACKEDVAKFCANVPAGKGRIRECLQAHLPDLSAQCRAQLTLATRRGWAHGPCAEDVRKFCSEVPPGQGRLRVCLEQHRNELSPACGERLAAGHRGWKASACAADVERFCRDLPRGGGRIRACLEEHRDQLSAQCQEQLNRRGQQRNQAR